MAKISIHPDTTLGHVHLTVADLSRSLPFYQQVLGFKLNRREGDTAYLGATDQHILLLTENPNARRARHATGLYHFAVLVPTRFELAQSLRRIAETETPVQGFSDHLVSEAIYLADPDGNGIEIYRDRPRSQWRDAGGNFRMGSEPLDINGILAELKGHEAPWQGLDPATVLGHMHLHVSHIPEAKEFYTDVLGFEWVMGLDSAGFVSAGGYHHHIGFNTWGTLNAPPPPPDSIGLRYFIVRLPDLNELQRVTERVQKSGLPLEETNEGLMVRDPSQNAIVLTAVSTRVPDENLQALATNP